MNSELPASYGTSQGVVSPRLNRLLIGHEKAILEFLSAWDHCRMHHAWLLHGPSGIGKATFAWHMTRKILGKDTVTLRQIDHGTYPGVLYITCPWDAKAERFKTEIPVESVRSIAAFLGLTSSEKEWRVIIIDPADHMSLHAENCLLKILEDPPQNVLFFLTASQPEKLLATVRSRCRSCKMTPLTQDQTLNVLQEVTESSRQAIQLIPLVKGSPGMALRLSFEGGEELYQKIIALFQNLPDLDRLQALEIAQSASGVHHEGRFITLLDYFRIIFASMAEYGAIGKLPHGTDLLFVQRLAPDLKSAQKWAYLFQKSLSEFKKADSLRLDASQIIFELLCNAEATAQEILKKHPSQ